MSWLWQPLGPGGVDLLSVAPPDIPRGIPMGNTSWLWQALPAAAALLDAPPIIPPVGPTVVATLLLDLEPGASVAYEWSTDLSKSWSGKEQRIALLGAPRIRINGMAPLVDGADRTYRAQLVQHAASGSAFLLGLPYEELSIAADSTGTVVTVHSTAYADWMQPGQRCLVVDVDDRLTDREGYVVQSSTSTTITLDAAVTVKRGGRIMPAVAVYLEAQQGLGRHVVNRTDMHLSVRVAEFGFAGVDTMGVGASGEMLTYTDPVTSIVYNVWWRRDIDDVADDSLQSQAQIIDLGGIPIGVGSALEPDWGRQVMISGSDTLLWQWLKAFLFATRGRQTSFLLPTWRPDLVYVGVSTGELIVASGDVEGAGDVVAWLAGSPEHRRLLVEYDFGDWYIVNVAAYADNLDGTVTLDVGQDLDADPTMICFVELVRWESDVHAVTWQGNVFAFNALARVVQQ